jgi:hypothetical protein
VACGAPSQATHVITTLSNFFPILKPTISKGKTVNMSFDYTRDPCPFVTVNDFGGAFCMVPLSRWRNR